MNINQNKVEFNPSTFEAKWQKAWEEKKVFAPDLENAKKPYMNLMMFPYPSAEGLHVGNVYAQTGADVYGRFQRMQGNDVFEPMGLDGFGIHSENYALKIGKNPMEQARVSQDRFYTQMKSIGTSIDWSRTLETYDPLYYRWTQWLFIQLFKAGLAYRKKAEVNWCPKDLTVLSDEQVIDGKCERCDSVVEKRELEQWFFRITSYADRLLNNIEKLDWTEKVKIAQKNWIGKKTGINISYDIEASNKKVEVFTTRPDTNFGATFIAISPEHPLVSEISTSSQKKAVEKYIQETKKKTDRERQEEGTEKTGVFTGAYAINQLTGYKMPIWVSDFVLMGFGTGALVGVPGHDKRDFEFAQKFGLEVIRVVAGEDGDVSPITTIEQVQEEEGKMINSGFLDGMDIHKATEKIMDYMQDKNYGKREATYHLRDWLISRQRYWGPPIPMVYCENCASDSKGERTDMPGWYSVPLKQLPVLLPDVEDWKPKGTGLSPLANHPEFYNVACPECGKPARRETDVSDTFLDSAWYFLGYISPSITGKPKNSETVSRDIKGDQKAGPPWTKNVQKQWLPVKKYIGGAEHSVLHLLYARFISMVLADLKFTDFEEPFTSFFAHGLIIKDGAKMSKSKGNVVVPDTYIEKYGADTLRTYLMFLGPFSDGGDFRDSGIEGMARFIRRVWALLSTKVGEGGVTEPGLKIMHKTIKKVTEDISRFHYNTSIASLMEWYNFLSSQEQVSKQEKEVFLKLLAPFAPYMTEELWQKGLGETLHSIHLEAWPKHDEKYLTSDNALIIVQVNGKKRGEFTVNTLQLNDEEKIKAEAKVVIEKYLEGKTPLKVVYVPGKIINFVIN